MNKANNLIIFKIGSDNTGIPGKELRADHKLIGNFLGGPEDQQDCEIWLL